MDQDGENDLHCVAENGFHKAPEGDLPERDSSLSNV